MHTDKSLTKKKKLGASDKKNLPRVNVKKKIRITSMSI